MKVPNTFWGNSPFITKTVLSITNCIDCHRCSVAWKLNVGFINAIDLTNNRVLFRFLFAGDICLRAQKA
jgi:hypothetical protein